MYTISQARASIEQQRARDPQAHYVSFGPQGVTLLHEPGAGLDREDAASAFMEMIRAEIIERHVQYVRSQGADDPDWRTAAAVGLALDIAQNVYAEHGPHLYAHEFTGFARQLEVLATNRSAEVWRRAREEFPAPVVETGFALGEVLEPGDGRRGERAFEFNWHCARAIVQATRAELMDVGFLRRRDMDTPTADRVFRQAASGQASADELVDLFSALRLDRSLLQPAMDHLTWAGQSLLVREDVGDLLGYWAGAALTLLRMPPDLVADSLMLPMWIVERLTAAKDMALAWCHCASSGVPLEEGGMGIIRKAAEAFSATPEGAFLDELMKINLRIILEGAVADDDPVWSEEIHESDTAGAPPGRATDTEREAAPQPRAERRAGDEAPSSAEPLSPEPLSREPMSEGPPSEGPMSEGPPSEGPMPEGPMPEGPMPEGPRPDEPASEGPPSEGPLRAETSPPGPRDAPREERPSREQPARRITRAQAEKIARDAQRERELAQAQAEGRARQATAERIASGRERVAAERSVVDVPRETGRQTVRTGHHPPIYRKDLPRALRHAWQNALKPASGMRTPEQLAALAEARQARAASERSAARSQLP